MTAAIRTSFDCPPIPVRCFDWSAVVEGEYEPGQPIGYGRTEAEAIADLQEQLEERRLEALPPEGEQQ